MVLSACRLKASLSTLHLMPCILVGSSLSKLFRPYCSFQEREVNNIPHQTIPESWTSPCCSRLGISAGISLPVTKLLHLALRLVSLSITVMALILSKVRIKDGT